MAGTRHGPRLRPRPRPRLRLRRDDVTELPLLGGLEDAGSWPGPWHCGGVFRQTQTRAAEGWAAMPRPAQRRLPSCTAAGTDVSKLVRATHT